MFHKHPALSRLAAAAAVIPALALSACSPSGGESPTADRDTQSGSIVATTSVWADVASAVAGRDVNAVISDPSVDPHSYEATAADRATVESADLVVANGGTYDAALYTAADPDKVVSALPLVDTDDHEHDHEHSHEGTEHSWYSTATVGDVGRRIAERTGGDTAELDASLSRISDSVAHLPTARVAQVHPIADALIDDSPLVPATPEAYRAATVNHSEPSGAAVAAFIDALHAGEIDIVISSPQSSTGSAQRILRAARDAGVPVVDVYETPPGDQDFLDYFAGVVAEIGQAAR